MRQAGHRIASVKHWRRTIFRRDDCGVPARPEQRPCWLSPCRSPAHQSSFCAATRAWLSLCWNSRGEKSTRPRQRQRGLRFDRPIHHFFTTVGGPTRALTARHPIKLTSPRCHSAWQPNDHLSVRLVSLATNRVPKFKEYSIGSIVAPLQRHSEHHWTSYRGVFPNIGNNR